MAGNRQHILPKFLLKGFASHVDGDKIFTWVYRKNAEPFQTTIENVSVEKYFYGRQGELSADDEITKLESGYADLVNELRDAKDSARITDRRLPEFVAHLAVRTKHVRQFFRTSAEFVVVELEKYLGEPANFRRLLLRNPELISEELGKVLDRFNLPIEQKEFLLGLVEYLGPMIVDEQMPEIQSMLGNLMAQIKPNIAKAVKDGHIRTLAKNPAPEPRAESYQKLNWIVKHVEESLLMGDFGCLFEIDSDKKFKSLNDKDDRILNIYLPVSAHTLVVGTPHTKINDLHVSQINSSIAKCSFEYFVSAVAGDDLNVLSTSIGMQSDLLTKIEMDTLMAEILEDIHKQQ